MLINNGLLNFMYGIRKARLVRGHAQSGHGMQSLLFKIYAGIKWITLLNSLSTSDKIAEFANSVDFDEL